MKLSMKFTYSILGVLLLSASFSESMAQDKKWLDLEAGVALHRLQDLGHSPLVYKGQALFYGATLNKQTDRFYSNLHLSIAGSELQPSLSNEVNYDLNLANRNNIYGSYSLLKTSHHDKLDIAYGGAFAVFFDYIPFNHSANNLVGYELNISLNPAVQVSYKHSDKLKFSFSGSIPLFAYSIRPNSLGLFPLDDFEAELISILGGGNFVSINKLFHLHTRIASEISIKEKHLCLFYDYMGGVNNVSERKGFSNHKIGIQIPLNILWK